jgi:hypothetical protein
VFHPWLIPFPHSVPARPRWVSSVAHSGFRNSGCGSAALSFLPDLMNEIRQTRGICQDTRDIYQDYPSYVTEFSGRNRHVSAEISGTEDGDAAHRGLIIE